MTFVVFLLTMLVNEMLDKLPSDVWKNKFKEIVKAISVNKAEINSKILKYFKKDFYTLF